MQASNLGRLPTDYTHPHPTNTTTSINTVGHRVLGNIAITTFAEINWSNDFSKENWSRYY